jgi:hypothetical protein
MSSFRDAKKSLSLLLVSSLAWSCFATTVETWPSVLLEELSSLSLPAKGFLKLANGIVTSLLSLRSK